jgi:hypothetical protein
VTASHEVRLVVAEIRRLSDLAAGAGPVADERFAGSLLSAVADLLKESLPCRGVDPVERARVVLALLSVHGVDLEPHAVAIARMRLAVAALRSLGLVRFDQMPPEVGWIIDQQTVWADALLPLDDPMQPYNRG